MSFLAPWFLAGLALLGLPVWLHLLRQHKTTPKRFSSLMFFEQRTQSSIKHRRLKYLLLMAARLALLVLLILAFSGPSCRRGAGASGSGRMLIVAVDNSFSMRAEDRLSRAKREAAAVLNSRGARDRAQVLAVGSTVQALTQPVLDPSQLRAALESIQHSDARSSYGELARALRSIDESARIPVEVHFFSDMQKTSLPPVFADLRLGNATRLVLHPAASRAVPNYAVESVTAPRSVFDPKKARVQASVGGYNAPAAKRNVTLSVNKKIVGTQTVDLPENGRASVEFLGLDAAYGFNRAEIRIDGGDALPGDDVFFFAMERSDPRHVLFVHEARQQRGLLYYRAALESAAEGAFLIEPVTAEQSGNLNLSKYAFVVLSDTGSLPAAFENSLRHYVRGGGALLIAAGPAAAARPRVPVFDENVRESRYASRAGERFLTAGSMDTTHPVLRSAGRWENVKFYQAIRVDQGQGRVLARLADETPLLMEKRIGEGRALLFASTFDNISNDFPLHPSFVAFVEQTARYLTGSEAGASSYTVDSHVELRAEKGAAAIEVLDPRGRRALDLKAASTATSFALKETGFYDVGRANGRHDLVAVNADRKESDLELVPAESQALWQGTGSQQSGAAGTGDEQQQQQYSNFWWYFLLAAALFALIESLLASRYLDMEPADA
jgi:hypothetical protein